MVKQPIKNVKANASLCVANTLHLEIKFIDRIDFIHRAINIITAMDLQKSNIRNLF